MCCQDIGRLSNKERDELLHSVHHLPNTEIIEKQMLASVRTNPKQNRSILHPGIM